MGCLNALSENGAIQQQLKELQDNLQQATNDQRRQMQLTCLRDWQSKRGGWRSHAAWGLPLCKEALRACLSLSQKQYESLVKDRDAGRVQPAAKLQATQRQREDA